MYQEVIESVAKCFEQQASALEKHGGRVLTDSLHHHCWFFPPLAATTCHGTDVSGDGLLTCVPAGKTCNCGVISLCGIPAGTYWRVLQPPDSVDTFDPLPLPSSPDHVQQSQPSVVDFLVPKVAAFSCASELCQNVLTTAFIITQSHQ